MPKLDFQYPPCAGTRRQMLRFGSGLALASWLPAALGFAKEAPHDLGPALDVIRRQVGLPAAAAVITSADKILASGTCGAQKMGTPGVVSHDAHWQLGSITKTFTATLAAVLVDRGKLTWDTTLKQIYPQHARIMAPLVDQITVRQIVAHSSGMAHDDAFPWQGAPEFNAPVLTLGERRQRAVVLMLKAPLDFKPGTKTSYSNRAYEVLGAAQERIGGQPWESLIQNELARPLRISSLIYGEPALANPAHEPWPHIYESQHWKTVAPAPLEWYGYHVCGPAGGISLTLGGFARWMQAHLSGELSPGILSKKMTETIHTSAADGGVPAFGIGKQRPLGRTLSHEGTNGRNWARCLILPDHGLGIFLATNANATDHLPTANFLLWNTLLATALPGNWPLPAAAPPELGADEILEGEALHVERATGGYVDFQSFAKLSGKFHLWWHGAHDGDRLVLRFKLPRPGQYAVEGVFCRNADYGDVTVALGAIQKRVGLRHKGLEWQKIALGQTTLQAGVHDVTVVAHGNSGQDGVSCHLGLDYLRLQKIA